MNNIYEVEDTVILIDFITNDMNKSHKEAKKLLTNEAIMVNNVTVTKYNRPLFKGDVVSIKGFRTNNIDPKVEILYEDKNIIVVNKKAGLLTISTNNEKEKTLYHLVSNYVKTINKNARIFVVHRLDKDTSGIVMFAKSEEVKKIYQDSWDKLVKYRGYIALVEGKIVPKYKTITLYLKEDEKTFKVYKTNKKEGKEAITKYQVIHYNNNYSLLDVEILTGRKNQIRVSLSNMGYPIVGDFKYGSKDKSLKRLCLHANKLVVENPINKKIMTFVSDAPREFYTKVK